MPVIKLKKGLDINLKGKPLQEISELPLSEFYALKPNDYRNVTPKLLVKQGEKVKAGTKLFYDKYNEQIVFTSPVSGVLHEIKRGERRKILEIIVKADENQEYEVFETQGFESFDRGKIVNLLIDSGLWTKIVSRPYGIIPQPDEKPKDIHISTFDTAPLAPDYNFTLKDDFEDFQTGVDVLTKLTDGNVHVNVSARIKDNIFKNTKNAQINEFDGPHPAGNPGVQIHHINPINKGDKVWTVNPQDVVFIGRLFRTGKLDLTKIIAATGYALSNPHYYKIVSGTQISDILKDQNISGDVRIISGNVLTGIQVTEKSFIGAFDNMLTVIKEGKYYEMFGWMKPGWKKYTASNLFLSALNRKREWELDTNLHGGERPFVLTGKMEKVLPMDILPMQFLKACLAEDVDMIEKLGIYEIIEEDFALCEFISETKMNFQKIISDAINLMINEMGV